MASEFEEGLLLGLLIGEGHFGGDGRQPQVTLRMHERHDVLFRWIERTFPGGRLYGPYDHGGRRYYQWMARGAFLRGELLPILHRRLSPTLDRYAHDRLVAMSSRYARQLSPAGATSQDVGSPGSAAGSTSAGSDPSGVPGEASPTHGPRSETAAEPVPAGASRSEQAERIFAGLRAAAESGGPAAGA